MRSLHLSEPSGQPSTIRPLTAVRVGVPQHGTASPAPRPHPSRREVPLRLVTPTAADRIRTRKGPGIATVLLVAAAYGIAYAMAWVVVRVLL